MRFVAFGLLAWAAFGPAAIAADRDGVPASVVQRCGLYAYEAVITKVYDGDTVTADVDLGFRTWRRGESLRLFGIDAPELRGASRPDGLRSRDALRARVLGKEVVICTIKDRTGKYGRYLAEIYLGEENVNRWLVRQGFAVEYDGGARAMMAAKGAATRPRRFVRSALR